MSSHSYYHSNGSLASHPFADDRGHAALAFDAGLLEGKSGMVVRDSNAEPNEGQKGIWKPVEPA